jgi:hypothetical protein
MRAKRRIDEIGVFRERGEEIQGYCTHRLVNATSIEVGK